MSTVNALRASCALSLAVLIAHPALGQNVTVLGTDVSLRLGGTLQPRMTLAVDEGPKDANADVCRVGFGLRRLRFRLYANVGPDIQAFTQFEGSGQAAQVVDVRVAYRLNEHLSLRAGRFVGAQPRSFAVTSHSDIDAVDRPVIADEWARGTIGADGRDYGIEALYGAKQTELRLFVHNGFSGGNFRSGISDQTPAGTDAFDGIAVSAAGTLYPSAFPGVELGLHGGFSTAGNPNTALEDVGRSYVTYSGHFYWGALPGSQPLRFKADVIGINYEDAGSYLNEGLTGFSILGAARLASTLETFSRLEYFEKTRNGSTADPMFLTAGVNYSFSVMRGRPFHHDRLILAYSVRMPDGTAGRVHSVILQAQVYF